MKNKIKRVLMPIFLSVIFGFICGKLVYNIYSDKTELAFTSNKIYLLQSGAYKSYDNMRTSTMGYNYIYYKDDNLYKTIIGITKNKNNIDKIKKLYKDEILVTEYFLTDNVINKKIEEYDLELSKEESDEEIRNIVFNMLTIYQENDIKLTKVN